MFEQYVVASLGGGLNMTAHPLALRDDEWTFCDGFRPRDGTAEGMRAYQQINDGTWMPANTTMLGMVPDLTDANHGRMLLVIIDNVTSNVRLFRMTTAGVATEITVSGTAPTGNAISTTGRAVPTTAFLNGTQVIACGTPVGNYSLASYTGGATFTRIAPTLALKGVYLTAAAAHLILGSVDNASGVGLRRLYISDTLSTTVWDPAISNSADSIDLTGPGAILGIAAVGDGAVILTHDRLLKMTSTGSIPPFTVQVAELRGRAVRPNQYIVATPIGVVYEGEDDYYVMGGGGIGRKVYGYIQNQVLTTDVPPKLLWHSTFGSVIRSSSTAQFGYDTTTQAWWRRIYNTTAGIGAAHHEVSFSEDVVNGTTAAEHWFANSSLDNSIWKEDTTGATGHPNAYVDTKDFAFDAPMTEDYIDRIKVDWEPLVNAATDALTVYAVVRNDLAEGLSALFAKEFRTTPTTLGTTPLGTLANGASELPIRQRGKFIRFRFQQSSGRVRIRGFTIRRERAADRKT